MSLGDLPGIIKTIENLAKRIRALETREVGAGGGGHTHDASAVTFTPNDNTDWSGGVDPGNTDDGLDQLADRVKALEVVPGHAAVTLGAGSDPALALAGQELTLADVLTPAEHTAIGNGAPHHAAITLSADVDKVLSLSTQQLTMDVQDANKFLAGPVGGVAAVPDFRYINVADLPAHTHDASVVTYTPTVNTDWDGDADPGNTDDALDQLAERVDDLENAAPAFTKPSLAIFTPPGEPPTSNYATFDTRNQHPVLDFDAATDESIMWTSIMPRSYGGGGVTVYLHITDTNDTNAAHASYWDVCFERLTAQDVDSDGFAAVQSNHVHPNGTSGIPVICTITFTDGAQMDSVTAGDLYRIKVTRDANNGSDDWANDAELLAVEIVETS